MSHRYLTLAEPFVFETDKVKGSRFIAYLAPAADDAAVDRHLADVRTSHRDASHHCLAARVGHPNIAIRFGDDGEPGGSAGRPMLMQLEGRSVTNVCAVVVRYFGGTKLGVGGLVRAYGGAVAQALDRAPIVEVVLTRRVQVAFDYDLTSAMDAFVYASGVEPSARDFGSEVRFTFELPIPDVDAFVEELTNRTGGRTRVRVEGES